MQALVEHRAHLGTLPEPRSSTAPARTGRHESRAGRSTSSASSSGIDSARAMTPSSNGGFALLRGWSPRRCARKRGLRATTRGCSARLCSTSPLRSGCSSSSATQFLIASSSLNVVQASSQAIDRSPPFLPLPDSVSSTNRAAFGCRDTASCTNGMARSFQCPRGRKPSCRKNQSERLIPFRGGEVIELSSRRFPQQVQSADSQLRVISGARAHSRRAGSCGQSGHPVPRHSSANAWSMAFAPSRTLVSMRAPIVASPA